MAKHLAWIALLVIVGVIDMNTYVDGGSAWNLAAAAVLFFVAGLDLGAVLWNREEAKADASSSV